MIFLGTGWTWGTSNVTGKELVKTEDKNGLQMAV